MQHSSPEMSKVIHAAPLTAAAFAPFGTVIAAGTDAGRPVNQGRGRRIPGTRDFSHDASTHPVMDLYRIEASALPFTLTCLERHPLSSQVFTPMACTRYLVVVAGGDDKGRPDLSGVKAFLATSSQAVCYRRGVWHAPMIALDTPALMTMLMWEAGDARDCDEFDLGAAPGLTVAAPGS